MRYGRGTLDIEIPNQNLAGVLTIQQSVPLADAEQSIWEVLEAPIDSAPLDCLAANRTSACVVMSDVTRPVPNQLILPPILRTLELSGILREKLRS